MRFGLFRFVVDEVDEDDNFVVVVAVVVVVLDIVFGFVGEGVVALRAIVVFVLFFGLGNVVVLGIVLRLDVVVRVPNLGLIVIVG